jgi:hypothetical protein
MEKKRQAGTKEIANAHTYGEARNDNTRRVTTRE